MVKLSLVGYIDFQQALTATAAYGDEATSKHVQSIMMKFMKVYKDTMVCL